MIKRILWNNCERGESERFLETRRTALTMVRKLTRMALWFTMFSRILVSHFSRQHRSRPPSPIKNLGVLTARSC